MSARTQPPGGKHPSLFSLLLNPVRPDGHRYQRRPISIRWGHEQSKARWFTTHGWQTGAERVSVPLTGDGNVLGYRNVFGWTLHLGRLKICFGRQL